MPAALRLAIAQPTMYWTGDENTAGLLTTLEQAAAQGAALCVFPELAVTGFHRQIASAAKPDRVAGWLAAIGATCARHSIAAVVGAPTFGDDERIYNSMLMIDERGACVGVVQHAQQLARRTGAFVVQANWPMTLNYPELSATTGKSVVISPAGEIAFALPQAAAGLAVFTLGQAVYVWSPH